MLFRSTLFKVEAGEPLKRALALIQQHDVSQLPVFRGADVVGTLEEGDVLRTVLADAGSLEKPVDAIMGAPLPVVGAADPADVVTRLLAARSPAVLVRGEGSAIQSILTRFDMLQFIAGGE